MLNDIAKAISNACGLQIRSLQQRLRPISMNRRGAVALTFAITSVAIAVATATAVDFSRIAAGRAALQQAVDNAALSGAAAYVLYGKNDSFNAVAVSVATSGFCNATKTLPGGFTINASSGGRPCGSAQGPAVTATIAGYKAGATRIAAGSGCTLTNTVVAGFNCGFIVTVTALATTKTIFAGLLGASTTLMVTAAAANPFVDLAKALTPNLSGSAWNANSIWVYPLLLDSNGQPDFSVNAGALPDTSLCTGDPTQTSCGQYSMVASTKYIKCKAANPCTTAGPCPTANTCPANSTIFGGDGGVVQNILASAAVITATTPLGIAFQSAAGGNQDPPSIPYNAYGYNTSISPQAQPENECTWPGKNVYNTVAQTYDVNNTPLLVDANGYWTYPTHWFYSSFLATNKPPSQRLIDLQNDTSINPATNLAYQVQVIRSVPMVVAGVSTPATCTNPASSVNAEQLVTTYPVTGNSNCSLYIIKNGPSPPVADPTYQHTAACFDPTKTSGQPNATPGQQYAALSCQSYGGDTFAFFWNDMGGRTDDKDYANGTLLVTCKTLPKVILIN